MPYATWMPEELRRFDVQVEELAGWQRRGSAEFKPRGVVCHHTAAIGGGDRPSLRTCIEGRSDLPGPLCNILLTRSGVAVVVAAGRAHHAGRGGFRELSGNRSVFGIEAENDGRGEPWPTVQLEAYQRVVASLLSGMHRDETWCISHKEWAPSRKIDPTFDMDDFRIAVGRVIRGTTIEPGQGVLEEEMPFTVSRCQGGLIAVQPDGGVFAFEGAPFHGSLPKLNVHHPFPIVAGAWTPSGEGYWLVGRDGALFAFGDAPPIVGANVDPLRHHIGTRRVCGLMASGPASVRIVAQEAGGDFDFYDARA